MNEERGFGSEEGRLLLRLARPALVPAPLRNDVRRAIEARLAAGRRRAPWRLSLALAASLLVGSALAYGLTQLRPGVRPAIERPSPAPARSVPRPVVAMVEAPRPVPRPHARRVARALPLLVPEQAGPPLLWPAREPDDLPPAPAPPRLLIQRAGRAEVSLVLAGDRVVGKVGEVPVSLLLSGAQLLGKLGDRNVWLWLHGHEAEGYIGSAPVRFELADTPAGQELREGFVLHGQLPAQATRIATGAGALSWFPGCGAPLSPAGAGTYEGRCRRGGEARVAIPESWQRLAPLPRLILLSFFLTERDPRFEPLFR
jgi:hypothetical protein